MARSAPHPWHGTPLTGARAVVVGVIPEQSARVVHGAAELAQALGTNLVCVWSDTSRTLVATDNDGSLETTPLDPDHVDSGDSVAAEWDLATEVGDRLSGYKGPWRFVYTVGEATHALARVAHEHDAWMIAVGSRRAGLGGWMNHLVGGSTAGRLAHTQPVPVTIVPQNPKESP